MQSAAAVGRPAAAVRSVRPRPRLAAAAAAPRPRLAVRAAAEAAQQSEWAGLLAPAAGAAAQPPPCGHALTLPPCPPRAAYATFLEELRDYSMKLHTKSQAPKEGQAPEPKNQKPVG